jgi:type VI secretion system secreted protein Hcp
MAVATSATEGWKTMPTPAKSGSGDMFLKIKGAKSGPIKGEANDQKHKEEIEVLSWSWGMQAQRSLGGGQATGKASLADLKVTKKVDKASTALMQALRTNEPVEATLTLRKSGSDQLEYLKISIFEGRVTSLVIGAGDESGGAELLERISFSFNKINVEYTPQGPDGQARGATSFEDQWTNG